MKFCLLFLFLLPISLLAQDCSLKKSTDPFTHVTKLSTGFKSFDGNNIRLAISADVTATEIDFLVWLKGDGKCFDDESTLNIVYEGEKSKATLRNTGSMNCEGTFHFSFKNSASTNSTLNRLATKKLATLKLNGSNKAETLITLTEEQKTLLQTMVNCIIAEGKTLLKK